MGSIINTNLNQGRHFDKDSEGTNTGECARGDGWPYYKSCIMFSSLQTNQYNIQHVNVLVRLTVI